MKIPFPSIFFLHFSPLPFPPNPMHYVVIVCLECCSQSLSSIIALPLLALNIILRAGETVEQVLLRIFPLTLIALLVIWLAHAFGSDMTNPHWHCSAIMDCVGCEKCRLWGKLQVLGLGTALKILFSVDGREHLLQNVSIYFLQSFWSFKLSLGSMSRFLSPADLPRVLVSMNFSKRKIFKKPLKYFLQNWDF